MYEKIISYQSAEEWRQNYRYALYNHKLISSDGVMYSRPFIVVKNHYNVIVRFTNLHNYAGIYEKKVFVPITSDAEAKLHYICKMLNYVLIQQYYRFRINHIFRISRDALECFFRDYAMEMLPDGKYRGEQSIENCVRTITSFFQKLRRKFGGHILLRNEDLFTETIVYDKSSKKRIKNVPALKSEESRKLMNHSENYRLHRSEYCLILRSVTCRTLLLRFAYRRLPGFALVKCAMCVRKVLLRETDLFSRKLAAELKKSK